MAVRGAQIVFNSSLQFAQQYAAANYGQGLLGYQVINGVIQGGTPNILQGQNTLSVPWVGGRTALSIEGTIPAGLQLQVLGPGGTWMQAGSGVITISSVAQVYPNIDLPQGQYRLSGSGLTTAIFVQMTAVPYGL